MVTRMRDTLLLAGGAKERAALRSIFDGTYDLLEAENVFQSVMLLEQNGHCIAAVLADLPLGDGGELRTLVETCHGKGADIPLLFFVSGTQEEEEEERAFALGVNDVVRKPCSEASIRRRVQILEELYQRRAQLEKAVAEQSRTIRKTSQAVMDALSAIIEHRSTESGKHVLRIRRFTRILLEEVALNHPEYGLTETLMDTIASAAALHDIGKISIPDEILNKPGKLTEDEFEVMKTHTTVGGELVQQLQGVGSEEYLRYAYNIAMYHHERWDGGGYPSGLKGDEIPICAQVVGIADAYDALTTERPYKKAFHCATAVNMILNGECGAFSPALYECFKRVRHQFATLAVQYADGYSPKNDNITVPLPQPSWNNGALSSADIARMKYQTLMHYMGDTIVEMNFSDNIYHVVYSPDADMDSLISNVSLRGLLERLFYGGTHKDDMEAAREMHRCLEEELFTGTLRRKSCVLRLYSASAARYLPYRVTLLRINTKNESQRAALMLLHRLDGEGELPAVEKVEPLGPVRDSRALRGLVCTPLRCRGDEDMTLHGGQEGLFSLTGYTLEEIDTLFGGRYLEMIYESDRFSVAAAVRELTGNLARGEIVYRLKGKDGTVRWVLDKARGFVETDGRVYCYHAVTDHSRMKEVQFRYEDDLERNRAIIDQSNGIVFEWDMASDTMYCSPKWEEHFGYAPVSKNYGAQMGIATHFHPDDLPIVREAIRRATEEHAAFSFDVRIANKDAKYLWTHVSGVTQLNEKGELRRIIGMLQDVDAMKRAEMALRDRAERDALTQLLNKDTTRRAVSEAMTDGEGELSALLVLDLDNFKHVNDTYGHLYGDAVLTRVGQTLKKLFRENDIIGRVGGDEFVVYMRDIPHQELLHRRCEQMVETFAATLAEMAPGLEVSCSIGAAFFPRHGESYQELFQHADEALYHAKNAGKATYTVYDPRVEMAEMVERAATAIDSDTEPGMAEGSFVQFVFGRLYESCDIFATVDELLRYVGQQLNADRVYIFENNADNTTCSNTFEWCNEGITPEKDNLQDISYIDDIAGWTDLFDERGVFYCTDISALDSRFRAILEPQGIKSMLQCAIYDNGIFRGYVGFDDCTMNRLWTREQIDLLQFIAQVLAMFLLKKRAQDSMAESLSILQELLNRQEEWIYVIDPRTHQLKLLNDAAKKLTPEAAPGMICYEVLQRRMEACENCPARGLQSGQKVEGFVDNKKLGIRTCIRAEEMEWKGRELCLMTVRPAEKDE